MKKITNIHFQKSDGFVAPLAMVLMFFLLMFGVAAVNISGNTYAVVQKDNMEIHAQFAADAGIDEALQNLSDNASWTAPSGQVEVMNLDGIRTTYELNVRGWSGTGEIIVRSIGRTFRSASPTSELTNRIHEATLVASPGTVAVGNYNLVTGPGGLEITGSGPIAGNVYIGGALRKSGAGSLVPGSGNFVQVADSRCGSGSTFPRICTSADGLGEPITYNTGSGNIVTGVVYANNQTTATRLVSPGLTSGRVFAYKLAPPDRTPIKNAMSSTRTGTAASCTSNGSTRVWPANVKIEGNVDISGSSCTVTISGNVWITGNLRITGSGVKIQYASGLTQKPIIMVDGPNGINFTGTGSITSSPGAHFVAYHSTASCNPECADVTGENLRNSMNITTIRNEISSYNNDFMAAWSTLHLEGTGGDRGSATGQRVIRGGTGTLTTTKQFNTSTGVTGSGTIHIKSYQRLFDIITYL